jgi:hypothetical protein
MGQGVAIFCVIPAAPAAAVAAMSNARRQEHRDAAQAAPEGSAERTNHLRYKAYHERQLVLSILVGLGTMACVAAYFCALEYREKMDLANKFAHTGHFQPATFWEPHFLRSMQAGKWIGVATAGLTGVGLVHAAVWQCCKPAVPDVANRPAPPS